MTNGPQESGFSDREQELIANITTALRGMDRRTQANQDDESTVVQIDRRCEDGPKFPNMFIEIIRIFQQTRDKVFHATDMEGEHHASLIIDLSLGTPELRLNIATDKRGKWAKWLGIYIDQITTKILVLTSEGYRITTAADLEKHRFITGGPTRRLRIAKYGPNSIMPILDFLRRFHGLIQQAASHP